jgi:hypothetical protein
MNSVVRVTASDPHRDEGRPSRDAASRRVTFATVSVTVEARHIARAGGEPKKKAGPESGPAFVGGMAYCGGNTAKASISTSHAALTRAATPTVDRAGFTGLVALLKNSPYAAFQPIVSIVPPFSLSGTR